MKSFIKLIYEYSQIAQKPKRMQFVTQAPTAAIAHLIHLHHFKKKSQKPKPNRLTFISSTESYHDPTSTGASAIYSAEKGSTAVLSVVGECICKASLFLIVTLFATVS